MKPSNWSARQKFNTFGGYYDFNMYMTHKWILKLNFVPFMKIQRKELRFWIWCTFLSVCPYFNKKCIVLSICICSSRIRHFCIWRRWSWRHYFVCCITRCLSTMTVLSALISGLNTCLINGTCYFLAQLEVFKADDTMFV